MIGMVIEQAVLVHSYSISFYCQLTFTKPTAIHPISLIHLHCRKDQCIVTVLNHV
jgi:hypothetical protein